MDIFQQIREDHQMVGSVIGRLMDQGSGDARAGAEEIGNMLVPHAKAEEAGLYPALQEHDEARQHIDKALQEHQEIVQRLNDFGATPMNDDKQFRSRLKTLQDVIMDHVKAEEGKTFDLAADLLSDQQIMDLSRRFPMDKQSFQGQWRMAA